jgi:hypothetical protein
VNEEGITMMAACSLVLPYLGCTPMQPGNGKIHGDRFIFIRMCCTEAGAVEVHAATMGSCAIASARGRFVQLSQLCLGPLQCCLSGFVAFDKN